MSSEPTKNIVVVGAGASARNVVKNLKAAKGSPTHITLIQPNKFASMPFYQTLVLTNRETFVKNSTFAEVDGVDKTIYGVAVGCSDGSVAVQSLENGDDIVQVPFDVLVCATGFSFPVICETPGQSQNEREEEIKKYADALTSGGKVVIAGGGAVGVELAADLLEVLPEDDRKGKVILVCSSENLLADQPVKYGLRVKDILEGLGAEIIFQERVMSHENSEVATDGNLQVTLKSGQVLECKAYVAAYGRGANTSWLTTTKNEGGDSTPLPDGLLDGKGRVIVDEYLQSTTYDKLYALGATASRDEPSLFMNIDNQAKVVAKNIINPKTAKQGPGVEHAVYQIVGHDTYASMFPENLPMPGFCATLLCSWCGFPCNMLCPCFCVGALVGPCDPMMCGYCCAPPEGKGLANTLRASKEANMIAEGAGYYVKGKPGFGEEMERS